MDKATKRFWKYVDIRGPDDCWEWKGGLNSGGYGAFWYKGRAHRSNRISWEIANGPIPEGRLICHTCDSKTCVNPNHLYLCTHCDNMADLASRQPGYAGVTHARLYEGEIWLIRRLKSDLPAWYVSRMFKVSISTIYRLWRSKSFLCKEGMYV